MAIGDEVKRLRDSLGWSQRKLAAKAELGNSTISRIESGDLHPEPDTLKKLAGVLPTSYEHLMAVADYVETGAEEDLYTVLRRLGFDEQDLAVAGRVLNGLNPRVPLRSVMNPALAGAPK